MKIRILRTCGIAGKHVEAGAVMDVPKQQAIQLVTLRRAEIVADENPLAVENPDPFTDSRDPAIVPTKRGPGRPKTVK